MGSLFKKGKTDPREQKRLNEWYEQMNREMEWDSHFEDFSISEEWDKDFREAMNKALEEKERKQKRRKRALAVAACVAVVLTGVGINQREVIGECLKDVFENHSKEAGSEHTHFGTKEDLNIIPDKEQDRIDFDGNTLEEVYAQIKEKLKRPIFRITNDFGEYKMIDAYYEDAWGLLVINLETSEGKIYLSQEERMKDGGTGVGHEGEMISVWNGNIGQDILVSKSIQDDSCTFFINNQDVIFNFHGFVSLELCCKIAENIVFQ